MIYSLKKKMKKFLMATGLVKPQKIFYKIGNLKHQNARIDELTPMLVEIGDDFVSAPGAIVLSHDASTFMHTGKYRVEKTLIGDRVFLGANSTVLPGVKIGNNVIVGAGSVVTKDVPDNMVIAGNPAKIMCSIEDYFIKCKEKGCLYEPPKDFQKIKNDGRPGLESIIEFQKQILRTL